MTYVISLVDMSYPTEPIMQKSEHSVSIHNSCMCLRYVLNFWRNTSKIQIFYFLQLLFNHKVRRNTVEIWFANFCEIRSILNNYILHFAQNFLAEIFFASPLIISTTLLPWFLAKKFQSNSILIKWLKIFIIYLIHSLGYQYKLSLLFEQFIKVS